ncbi:ABC transporter permease [Bacillus sp. JJ1521]|uniref:ABC transporter permease n=1 Tax=Bacillus sp. JJ1521 TaxID=3122957 RepID=UPI0030001661
MTLFSLAKTNIKKNTRSYLLYFYPMVFSMMIYFIFVSLQYNNQIVHSATALGKVQPAFMAASVLLLIFSAIFIWYSNHFFTRKRKKEVALYSLFGMRKKQIAKLLFYENLIMGFVALGAAIGIGILLSKLFAMLLVKLMGFSFIAHFDISNKAIIQSLIVFISIIAVTSFRNYRMIYRYTLMELLKADNQGDKQQKGSRIAAVLSIVMIGIGCYGMLLPSDSGIYREYGFTAFLFSLLFVLVGTFLFMHSVLVALLDWIARMKGIYFKGTNLISVSHLRFRIKGNVLILSVIALLSTITLFVLGTIFSLHQNLNAGANENNPLSIMYTSRNNETDTQIGKLINESQEHKVVFSDTMEYLQVEGDLSPTERWPDQFPVILIMESEYKRLAEKIGLDSMKDIEDGKALVFNDGNLNQATDPYTGKTIILADQVKVTIDKYEKRHLLNQNYSAFPMVINDQMYQELREQGNVEKMQIYKLVNDKSMEKLINEIEEMVRKDVRMEDDSFIFTSFYHEYQKGVQTYGLLIFIGAFLGIVFLLATGSMLYYKQLTEATADQGRYQVLRKIGMSHKQISNAIAKQLLPVFMLPLVIAIPSSTVIIVALARFAHIQVLLPFSATIAIYLAIYSVYYLVTWRKYYLLVKM